MATTYNETRVNLSVPALEADGKTVKLDEKTSEPIFEANTNNVEKKANEIVAEFKTKGLPDVQVTKVQTFQYTEVTDPNELVSILLPNNNNDTAIATKLAIDIINRGLVLAQQKSVRDFMTDDDQQPIEGVYDLMQDVKPGEGRRKADPRSKAMKSLSELLGREVTAAELDVFLSSFANAGQPVGA